ncbi:MAG TPA: SdiA-regulated domain-containing protein [Anseongella sp.]|nr:SdiA-regulated domain-containing protein [Anseongella sp.]
MKAFFLMPFLLLACAGTATRTAPSLPEGYTYENLQEVRLEKELEEISGIEYEGGGSFLAHNDEEGIIYRLEGEYKVKAAIPFAGEGDYEEIKKVGSQLYMLSSKGDLWSMQYKGTAVSGVEKHEWPGSKTEFEAMFHDPGKEQLVLVSKSAKADKEARRTHAYAFGLSEKRFHQEPVFSLGWEDAGRAAGKELKGLHPSAAAVHPLTGEIYLLASIERLLLVLGPDRQIRAAHRLDKKLFPQPEGITFDERGNLYISNEAAEQEEATLLVFSYQTSK